jgi:UPF0716 protein FxsA
MGPLLFVAFLVVPILELWVIIQVGQEIGVLLTIALLIAVSIAGTWLLKQQGLATWQRVQQNLAEGRMPADEVIDGALILFGGALLLTPGFLTDVVGLTLLIPPTRAAVRRVARRTFRRWIDRRTGGVSRRQVYEATVIRSERTPTTPSEERPPPELRRPGGADGSPDRG